MKARLFTKRACRPGVYGGTRRPFCLHEDLAEENLHAGIRAAALAYFAERKIGWHDGKGDLPSNHLCCSQSCCINFWFPFVQAPQQLAVVLRDLGYDVAEMLPFEADRPLADGSRPYVAFEWIGQQNYLGELSHGKVAPDEGRTRGAGFTSLDFCFRFRRSDGHVQIVAGEWKYTEYYPYSNLRFSKSKSGTDRLADIYGNHFGLPNCQILKKAPVEAFFFDPFDQLMRQQLLCSAMERHQEMGADIVSLLHVAPTANKELMNRVTSSQLTRFGSNLHGIWTTLVAKERFKGVAVEALLPLICANAPTPETRDYLELRYGGMG